MSEYLKTLSDLAQTAGGTVTLDLSKQAAFDSLVEKYGGAGYLADEARELKQALDSARTEHQAGRGLSRRSGTNGLQDDVYIAHAAYDAAAKKFMVRCVASFTKKALVCNLQIDILDKNQKQIGKYYIVKQNVQFMAEPESGWISLGAGSTITDSVFTVMVTVSAILEGQSAMANVVSSMQFSTDDLISTADVAHPIKKFSNPDPIYVFYGRFPNKRDHVIDYIYEEALHESVADMKLDIMGSAVFKNGVETVKTPLLDECTAIMDLQRGTFRYGKKDGMQFLNTGAGGFAWVFDNDWGGTISRTAFQASNKSYLSVRLRYKAGSTADRRQTMMLSSFLADNVNPGCRAVRMFDLKIGCLAKGTLIRMADCTQRCVEEVRAGDRVICGTGGESKTVSNIFSGPEKSLIVVETQGGQMVALTATHLVKTESGLVEAQALNAGMKVLTEAGFSPIKYLYEVENSQPVYDLQLEGTAKDNLVSAGGIFVGEVNTAAPPPRTVLDDSTGYSELYREFDRIDKR